MDKNKVKNLMNRYVSIYSDYMVPVDVTVDKKIKAKYFNLPMIEVYLDIRNRLILDEPIDQDMLLNFELCVNELEKTHKK